MRAALLRRELCDLTLVAAGAIPGALLRWRLTLAIPHGMTPTAAWLNGTVVANLCGCLLIGMLAAQPPRRARLFLWGGIGLCGSLTTFSSWILQLTQTLQAGLAAALLSDLLLSLGGGLALTTLGYRLGCRLARRSP